MYCLQSFEINYSWSVLNMSYIITKQYGFIKWRSAVTQLIYILDKFADYLDSGGQIDVIYSDLEKAFDKVSHCHLINKLKYYKINQHLIGWIKSFLTNRSQRFRINDTFSNWTRPLWFCFRPLVIFAFL